MSSHACHGHTAGEAATNGIRYVGWLRLLQQIFHQDKWICLGGE